MNTLELKKHATGSFETTIKCDGVTSWELHPSWKTETKILETIRERKYFQHYKDEWCITLPDDHRIFRDEKLDVAIQMAIVFIQTRDHPNWEDDYL